MALNYQNPCEGRILNISWERSGLLTVYRLQRSLHAADGEKSSLIYEGRALSFTDTLPAGAQSVQYRLTGSDGSEQEGELLSVRQSEPPHFLSEGRDLGKRCRAFSVPYEAQDSFPDARLSARVSLDGSPLESIGGLSSPIHLTASVDEKTFSALRNGTAHTLKVTLSNEFGRSSSLSFSFTVSSDETAGCTFYLLRDGKAVAKKEDGSPFFDYRAAGSHRYQVRVVDEQGGFCDSNEVSVISWLETALLAPLSNPERSIALSLQSEGPPLRQSLLQPQNQLHLFEGREYAALEESGQRSQRFTLCALLGEEEYRQLLQLFSAGEPVLYRDPYGNCMPAAIDSLSSSFSSRGTELKIELTRLCEQEEVFYD